MLYKRAVIFCFHFSPPVMECGKVNMHIGLHNSVSLKFPIGKQINPTLAFKLYAQGSCFVSYFCQFWRRYCGRRYSAECVSQRI